ncbi:MAG TPA: hypothetical protein VK255_00900 [Patescibacteria group bacterium]|nr:hypothetical protein [Patescibacteria group bacterium]
MDRRRIIAHIWMFILIFLGIALAFYFVPSLILLSRINRYYLTLAIFPLLLLVFYNLTTAVFYRQKIGAQSDQLEKLTKEKPFGRLTHPSCTTFAILAWIFFLYFPTLKIFLINVWISIVILLWIKLEKSAYSNKPPKTFDDTSGP